MQIRKIFNKLMIMLLIVCMVVTPVTTYAEGESDASTDTSSSDGSDEVDDYDKTEDEEGALSHSAAVDQAIVSNAEGTIFGHTLIAENDKYELYLLDETLSIIVRDKETGAIMESTVTDDDGTNNATWSNFMKSGVVVQVIEGKNTITTNADLITQSPQVDITKNSTGFIATVYYDQYGIGYTLNVELTEDGITATIPDDTIIEENEGSFTIGSIYVFPFLGYTYLGERDGYMFVPDGNGALIYLEDNDGKYSSAFTEPVYGSNVGYIESYILELFADEYEAVNDAENIMAPVYGMVHTDTSLGYIAVIESGEYNATIEAYPNGAYTNYNWITASFEKRRLYVQPTSSSGNGSTTELEADRNHYDIKINYMFVDGDDADYAGLAVKYRDYLIDNGTLEFLTSEEDDFNVRLDFLGSEKKDWLIFKKTVTMTTVDNIREMISELSDEGVNSILALYKGWQKGGLYNLPITKYKADSSIGGTRDLTSLINDMNETEGVDFYLYQDALRSNPDTNSTTYNVIKKIDKRLYKESTYQKVYDTFYYLTPNRTNEILEDLASTYSKKGIDNIALGGISDSLFSYTYSGKAYTRTDTADSYTDTLSQLSESFNLLLEKPYQYLWGYTGAIMDMPTSSSNYIFTDEEVPFFSIVLKGSIPMYSEYVNFEANKTEFFLNLVETGVYPSFYITYEDPADLLETNSSDVYSSQYSTYKNDIVEYYNELKAVNEKVYDAHITGHEKLDSGVTVVTYSNGVVIYVNYSDKDVTVDGVTVKALSYEVGDTNE